MLSYWLLPKLLVSCTSLSALVGTPKPQACNFMRCSYTMCCAAYAGATAFVAGAAAALGSSVVKVPLAVCIRSVQAGIYKNVVHAAKEITKAAGVRGLFTVSLHRGGLGVTRCAPAQHIPNVMRILAAYTVDFAEDCAIRET